MDQSNQSSQGSNNQDELSLPPVMDDQQGSSSKASYGLPIDPTTNNTPTAPARPMVATPIEAGDDDLIEKEWVEKAKQIVDHTNTDPHLQQNELSKIKADYMKKRYNKDIKVSDS